MSDYLLNDQKNLAPLSSDRYQIDGVFRLTQLVTEFDRDQKPILQLRLSCSEGDFQARVWPDCTEIPEGISHLSLLRVSGYRLMEGGKACYVLNMLRHATYQDLAATPQLYSMPRIFCAEPELLGQLVSEVGCLQSDILQEFIRRVLERRDVVEAFLRVPASRSYHHSEPMGLLKHSLEVARSVLHQISFHEPDLPVMHRELGFVGGLFHDIGKIRTYDTSGKLTENGRLVQHDAFTLEVCANALGWLDGQDPSSASALRHIWTCASPGARYGMPAKMTLARYVRDADGISAMRDNQRKAFRCSPRGTRVGSIGNQQFGWP